MNNLKDIYKWIIEDLEKPKPKTNIVNIFAFNGTWKTRLSQEFENKNIILENEEEKFILKSLCYNSYFEDLFNWDNENLILNFHHNWVFEFIKDQWFDTKIINNFKNFWNTKIEPEIDLEDNKIIFNIPTWDDDSQRNVKISRAEEINFIWTVFYSVLEAIIDSIKDWNSDFSDLKYIVIDDPISSIDDWRVIAFSIKLLELFKEIKKLDQKIKIVIFTHHSLFYSFLFNKLDKKTTKHYFLSKDEVWQIFIKKQKKDSPFWYHLLIKNELDNIVKLGNIERKHFNLFRSLLEKTSNFLWLKEWQDCLDSKNFTELINIYSHDRLDNIHNNDLLQEEKDLFIQEFKNFVQKFNFQ